ncbi:MAG: J domain-containing protein [Spirochaetales bacterium]|nr:J domain-containing protein [Spirochaetales bacterium]
MVEADSVFDKQSQKWDEIYQSINKNMALISSIDADPILRRTLQVIRLIGDKISTFFQRICELLKTDYMGHEAEFVSRYFYRNFSIISENTRAARSIINYVMKRKEWLKEHAQRIVEALKTLYSSLLAMQIDCEELYKIFFSGTLTFNLGLNFNSEEWDIDFELTLDKSFEILDLPRDADREQVKYAFRHLAKTLHPDLNPGIDRDKFISVEKAYKFILARLKNSYR